MARKRTESPTEDAVKSEKKTKASKSDDPKEKKKSAHKGTENLIPLNRRSEEEKRKITSAGAHACNEVRRKKKELRELTQSFLQQEAIGEVKENLERMGFDAEDMTNLAAILGSMFMKVLKSGDLNAARTIIEWSGMSPMQQIQENAAMEKLQMIMGAGSEDDDDDDVVFFIPDNHRDGVNAIPESELQTID